MDFIAGLFELFGLIVIGNKNKLGFVLNLIGNILWTIVAFKVHVYGLLLVVVPAMAINCRNYRKWKHGQTS